MKRLLCLALMALLLLSGCAQGTDVSAFAPGEEERLVIYTSHKEEVYGPIIKEFQQRTGIWVEVVTGGSGELLERIAMEAEGGQPACDLMFGGGVESLAAYEDCFEPCTPEGVENLRGVGLSEEGLWTPFSSLPLVLIYNTRLVSEGELTGWADLLDPRWKGRIAFCRPHRLRLQLHGGADPFLLHRGRRLGHPPQRLLTISTAAPCRTPATLWKACAAAAATSASRWRRLRSNSARRSWA
ncbi:MAG: extracellular solute-binding protein [Lachnospiraceae bacterium]